MAVKDRKNKFGKMLTWVKNLEPTKHTLTININEEYHVIDDKNWNELTKLSRTADNIVKGSIIIRREEASPTLRNGNPYHTLALAIYTRGEWIAMSEEAIKFAHTSTLTEPESMEVEEGILFGAFNDEYPTSPIGRTIF